jgi:hypothetical protein
VKPLYISQAVCLTVMTGQMLCQHTDLKNEVEKRLGRPINPVEFQNSEFIDDLKALFMDDFRDLCKAIPDSGIMLPR